MACYTSSCSMPYYLIYAALLMAVVVSPARAVDGAGVQVDAHAHRLHFYMHDASSGANPSAVVVVHGTGPPLKGSGGSRFGDTVVMDDVLTEGPSPASRAVGRAQGMYVSASMGGADPAMLISMNVLLADGPYNGSTLAVTGRNAVLAPVRELTVVGGTGRFRMARGYVLLKTTSWRGNSAVLELDVFVFVDA